VVTPDGSKVYVTNALGNTVSVISAATSTVTGTIAVGTAPREIAVTPDGSTVYASNLTGNSLSVIDTGTDTVTSTITGFSAPEAIAILTVPPAVTRVIPPGGSLAGVHKVTITGTGFTGATAVSFGGFPAASFTVDSATQITAVTPPHAGGTVDITVTRRAAPAPPAPPTSTSSSRPRSTP